MREQKLKGTLLGNVKEVFLTIGMKPFFDKRVSTAMLSLAIALPKSSCNMDIIEFFLAAGVMEILHEILEDVRGRVQDLSDRDNIENRKEHFILQFLVILNFPTFVAELGIFLYIRYETYN